MLLVHRYGSGRQRSIDSMWPRVNLRGSVKDPVGCASGGDATAAAGGGLFVGRADGGVDCSCSHLPETECGDMLVSQLSPLLICCIKSL